jgi:LysR family transcriptional regulator, regulator for metE and metH
MFNKKNELFLWYQFKNVMIEIKHLHLIKEIAETGNMTKASKRLFLTQPSLSHQLKEIESRLGVPLFLRINKTLKLTQAGKMILRASEEILPKLQSLEKHIKSSDDSAREVRVSTQCYTCYHWLPVLLKKFRQVFKKVEIDIVTEAMNDPIDYLLKGQIDIAITNYKTAVRGVTFEKIFDDEQVLLVPQEHRLAGSAYVKPADFQNENLIIYKEQFESDYFAQNLLIPQNVNPARVTKMQLTEARVELVKAGIGITVLSKWLVKPFLQHGNGLRQLRITKKGFFRTWYIACLSQKREDVYIKNFIGFLKEQELGSKKRS